MADTPRTGSIARRYAQAFFELAREARQIPEWRRQLAAAAEALSRPDVLGAIENPKLSPAERVAQGLGLVKGAPAQVRNLVHLLIERRRLRQLPAILNHYDTLADRESGILRAQVTTAVEPDEQMQRAIARALSQRFGKDVQTEVHQDPAILGGLVIRVGDRVIDDSVRTHLQQLQAQLA